MLWLPLALITAFSLSTADALSKRALDDTEEMVIVWVREGYALPFLAIGLLITPIPKLDSTFYLIVASLIPLEIAALVLYVKAIRLSPLSLTIPFMALSPVFIMAIAFFTLGERPTPAGLSGVALITAGAYTLNARAAKTGLLGPLKAIARERGSLMMIAVALIYSVTSTLGKTAVIHSNPVFFGFFYPCVLTAVLTVFLIARGKLPLVLSRPKKFIPIGFFSALMIITHFAALNLTQVAYMISVKRTSLLFTVLYGRLLFGEENIRERLAGAVIMLAGVALIALF